jgi:hypothetical protein
MIEFLYIWQSSMVDALLLGATNTLLWCIVLWTMQFAYGQRHWEWTRIPTGACLVAGPFIGMFVLILFAMQMALWSIIKE